MVTCVLRCSALLLVAMVTVCTGSRRVLMLPTMFASHILEMAQLGGELVRRGHEVHMVLAETVRKIPASLNNSGINFLRYSVDYEADPFTDQELFNMTLDIWITGAGAAAELEMDLKVGKRECGSLLKSKVLYNKIVSMKFDMAIVDGFGPTLCRYVLPYQAGIPYGSLTAVIWPYMSTIGTLPSVIVGLFSTTGERMGFLERCNNLLLHYNFWKICEEYYNLDEYMGSFDNTKPYTSLTELSRSSLFWIIETEGLLDFNRILLPHIHYIGGLSTKPARPLQGKLLAIAEKATDGLVIVSFGTRVTFLPQQYIYKFLKGLSLIDTKYTIIFKYTGNLDGATVPENLHIFDWLPQNDLLGHKNTKLFITHCGNNGRYEALYHGVPMLGFPFDADQPINAISLEAKGQGIRMDMKNFTPDDLARNVHEIMNNPIYRNRMKKASQIFRDLPNPRERGASIVEQVMKHGADHWKMAANDLSIFQITMIDIAACAMAFTLLFVMLAFFCFYTIYKRLNSSQKLKKA